VFQLVWPGIGGVFNGGIRVGINTPDRYPSIELLPPTGTDLAVGNYLGATRAAFKAPGEPGLDFSQLHWGCNEVRGEFYVHRVTVDEFHRPLAIDASFVQSCGGLPFLRGRLVINYDLPQPTTPASGAIVAAGNDQFVFGSKRISTSPQALVLGQMTRGGNTLLVSASEAPAILSVTVSAPQGQILQPGTYSGPTEAGDAVHPRLSFNLISNDFASMVCWTTSGSFTIHQIHYDADGVVDLLDLTFERVCDYKAATTGRAIIGVAVPNASATATIAPQAWMRGIEGRTVQVNGLLTCTQAVPITLAVTMQQGSFSTVANAVDTQTIDCKPGVSVPWGANLVSTGDRDFAPGQGRLQVVMTPMVGGQAALLTAASQLFLVSLRPATPRRDGPQTPGAPIPRRV
jgi:hypothetical protein